MFLILVLCFLLSVFANCITLPPMVTTDNLQGQVQTQLGERNLVATENSLSTYGNKLAIGTELLPTTVFPLRIVTKSTKEVRKERRNNVDWFKLLTRPLSIFKNILKSSNNA